MVARYVERLHIARGAVAQYYRRGGERWPSR
jgi:hypothetical protein